MGLTYHATRKRKMKKETKKNILSFWERGRKDRGGNDGKGWEYATSVTEG
jgi:hypothetical protein